MFRQPLFICGVASLVAIISSPGQSQQQHRSVHPNHNYFPNGTMMPRSATVYSPKISSSDWDEHWTAGSTHHPTSVDERKQQQLFKVTEWSSKMEEEQNGRPGPKYTVPRIAHNPPPPPQLPLPQAAALASEEVGPDSPEHSYEEESSTAGSFKPPRCAESGRYYCSYKEDYPQDVVTQVTKYLKWPLEKLFRDLKTSKLPKMAESSQGTLVCDSLTRVIRPGWAKNTNGKWLVVINTEQYQQYVTEIVCRYDGAFCNFIPPCYHATCQQRYNTQFLLVVDPINPYKGPFMSQFIFPSCCVCHIPNTVKV